MKNARIYLQKYPVIVKGLLFMYIMFAGCFVFPMRSELFPLNMTRLYLLIASYGVIGLGFAGIYGRKKEKIVYPLVLCFTILGMVCRYVLEYGEVSNTYNFTWINIVSYIAMIPTATVAMYYYIVKYLESQKHE